MDNPDLTNQYRVIIKPSQTSWFVEVQPPPKKKEKTATESAPPASVRVLQNGLNAASHRAGLERNLDLAQTSLSFPCLSAGCPSSYETLAEQQDHMKQCGINDMTILIKNPGIEGVADVEKDIFSDDDIDKSPKRTKPIRVNKSKKETLLDKESNALSSVNRRKTRSGAITIKMESDIEQIQVEPTTRKNNKRLKTVRNKKKNKTADCEVNDSDYKQDIESDTDRNLIDGASICTKSAFSGKEPKVISRSSGYVKRPDLGNLFWVCVTCTDCKTRYMSRLRSGSITTKDILEKGVRLQCVHCNKTNQVNCVQVDEANPTKIQHYGEPTLVCPMERCKGIFTTLAKYAAHKKRHDEDPRVCSQCGNIFKNDSQLSSHRDSVHRDKSKDRLCKFCGKGFKNMHELQRHEDTVHGKKPKYQCDICGKITKSKYLLERVHMLSHRERMYECIVCGKKFRSQQGLYTHKKAHFQSTKCDHCQKVFTTTDGYKKHMEALEVGGIKNHQPKATELTVLASEQQEVVIYNCVTCNKNFETQELFIMHLQEHGQHLVEIEEDGTCVVLEA